MKGKRPSSSRAKVVQQLVAEQLQLGEPPTPAWRRVGLRIPPIVSAEIAAS